METQVRGWISGLMLAGLLAASSAAHATLLPAEDSAGAYTSTVLYSQSPVVQGSGAATVTALSIPAAGELFVTLTDLNFPTPFSSLQFSLGDPGGALLPSTGLSDPGTLTLDLTQATTVYADVFATTQSGTDAGLYNLTATFVETSPVPLPASGLLFVCGLALAIVIGRKTPLMRKPRFVGPQLQPG